MHGYSLQVERTWAVKKKSGHMNVQGIQKRKKRNMDT